MRIRFTFFFLNFVLIITKLFVSLSLSLSHSFSLSNLIRWCFYSKEQKKDEKNRFLLKKSFIHAWLFVLNIRYVRRIVILVKIFESDKMESTSFYTFFFYHTVFFFFFYINSNSRKFDDISCSPSLWKSEADSKLSFNRVARHTFRAFCSLINSFLHPLFLPVSLNYLFLIPVYSHVSIYL